MFLQPVVTSCKEKRDKVDSSSEHLEAQLYEIPTHVDLLAQ